MLNNIASDLDLLLNDLCHIYPYPVTAERKFTTFGYVQIYLIIEAQMDTNLVDFVGI